MNPKILELKEKIDEQYSLALLNMLYNEVLFRLRCRVAEEKKWWPWNRTNVKVQLADYEKHVSSTRNVLEAKLARSIYTLVELNNSSTKQTVAYQKIFSTVSCIAITSGLKGFQNNRGHTIQDSTFKLRYDQFKARVIEKEKKWAELLARHEAIEDIEKFLGLDENQAYQEASHSEKERIERFVINVQYQKLSITTGNIEVPLDSRSSSISHATAASGQLTLSQKVKVAIEALYNCSALGVNINQEMLLENVATTTGRGWFRWPLEYRIVKKLLMAADNPNIDEAVQVDAQLQINALKKLKKATEFVGALESLQLAFDENRRDTYLPIINNHLAVTTEKQQEFSDSLLQSEAKFKRLGTELAQAYGVNTASNDVVSVIKVLEDQKRLLEQKNVALMKAETEFSSKSANALVERESESEETNRDSLTSVISVTPRASSFRMFSNSSAKESKTQELDRLLKNEPQFVSKTLEYARKIIDKDEEWTKIDALASAHFSEYPNAPKSVLLLYSLLTWYIKQRGDDETLQAYTQDCFELLVKVAGYLENFKRDDLIEKNESVKKLRISTPQGKVYEKNISAFVDSIQIDLTTEGCTKPGRMRLTTWTTSAGKLSKRIKRIFESDLITFDYSALLRNSQNTVNSSASSSTNTPVKTNDRLPSSPVPIPVASPVMSMVSAPSTPIKNSSYIGLSTILEEQVVDDTPEIILKKKIEEIMGSSFKKRSLESVSVAKILEDAFELLEASGVLSKNKMSDSEYKKAIIVYCLIDFYIFWQSPQLGLRDSACTKEELDALKLDRKKVLEFLQDHHASVTINVSHYNESSVFLSQLVAAIHKVTPEYNYQRVILLEEKNPAPKRVDRGAIILREETNGNNEVEIIAYWQESSGCVSKVLSAHHAHKIHRTLSEQGCVSTSHDLIKNIVQAYACPQIILEAPQSLSKLLTDYSSAKDKKDQVKMADLQDRINGMCDADALEQLKAVLLKLLPSTSESQEVIAAEVLLLAKEKAALNLKANQKMFASSSRVFGSSGNSLDAIKAYQVIDGYLNESEGEAIVNKPGFDEFIAVLNSAAVLTHSNTI